MRVALLYFNQFTGGSAGKTIPYIGEDYLNLQFFTNKPFYYLSLACLGVKNKEHFLSHSPIPLSIIVLACKIRHIRLL